MEEGKGKRAKGLPQSVLSPSSFGPAIGRGLALVMLILLPVNTVAGHRQFADWYHAGMVKLQSDLDAGAPIEDAARHGKFLVYSWKPEEVARHMHMLHDAGIPPFDRAALSPR